MHKIYIVTASDNVMDILGNYGLITTPAQVRNRDVEETIRRELAPRPAPRARARQPEELNDRYCQLMCQMFLSRDEAMDAINELSRQNMNKKWYLLESIAFVEVPPTQPILKQWNQDGELQL